MIHSSIRQLLAWVLALVASVLLASAVHAQGAPREAGFIGSDNIPVTLHADGAPEAGKEWVLALRFVPKGPEWHGYWSNPGDAGAGMILSLDLPPDWEVGEARYPVPKRLVIAGLMNHVYEGPYTVLVPVTPGPSAASFGASPITGIVDYLACTDQICVPQSAKLVAQAGGDFARWRAEVAPLLDARASFAITGKTLRIGIPLPASVGLSDPHVFVGNKRLVAYSAAQTFRRVGDMLVAEIPLDEFGEGKADALSGILSFGDGAGVRFAASLGPVPTGGELIAGAKAPVTPPLWTLILGALAGGLLLNIMPCVFPILSLKALSLARASESEAKARAEGLGLHRRRGAGLRRAGRVAARPARGR